MKNTYLLIFTIIITAFLLIKCSNNKLLVKKIDSNDPFAETIIPSEFFKINMAKDTVLRGSKGTLLVFQKGSIINGNGDIIEGKVDIELAEAFGTEDMVFSNLTTTSNGDLLETDGMIYFNVFKGEEQLYINPNKPVHIETPTRSRKANMQVYEGVRDTNGNMNWINPEPIESYLNAVDIFSLDLLPDGFEEAVEKEMPFRKYKTANKALIDSLYYSMHFTDIDEVIPETIPAMNVHEGLENNSFAESELNSMTEDTGVHYGVDPAIIKTLKTSAFQNTLISTKEFRERLQVIFKICRTDVIDIYTRNLDKNLWELDSIAAVLLDDNMYQEDFKTFAKQKWAVVKDSDVNTDLLKDFYTRSLRKLKKELVAIRNKVVIANNEKTAAAQKIVAEYQSLLDKREAYRMSSYGFQRTTTGWVNIDRGVAEKNWEYQTFEIKLGDSLNYKRAYSYIIYKSMKSLYRLNTNDQKTFYAGNEQRREMITPKNSDAMAIVIAYVDDRLFFNSKKYKTGAIKELRFDNLSNISDEELKKKLSQVEEYSQENSILTDLKYLDKIYEEELRQDKLRHERFVIGMLELAAFPLDSSFMRFNREYQIDMPIDTCINNSGNARALN